jgi:hypothetical protein
MISRGLLHAQRNHAVRHGVSSPGALAEGAENRAFDNAAWYSIRGWGSCWGLLNGLIVASDQLQQRLDELEWSDHPAWQAFERAEEKAVGLK